MLTRLIQASLKHRFIVLVVAALLASIGVASFWRLPFDAFPDTTPVQVTVNTVAPALTPLEVEQQLTFPVEQVLGGLPGLEEVRSLSKFGFSQVTVIFEDDVDVWLARQAVAERIATVELPPGVERPTLGPVSTGLGEVLQYVVRGDGWTTTQLREIHDWVVRPQLLSVSGVAEVNAWGGHVKQYHVVVDPERLLSHDLTLDDVISALQADNENVGGGYVVSGGESRLVQGLGLVGDLEELGNVVVRAREGVPVRVSDVARVELGHEIRRGAVTAGGAGEVVLGLGFMLLGENSRDVTRRLEARLTAIRTTLPAGVTLETVYTRSHLVDEVLGTVRENLFHGALLVVAVLFLFLGHLRAGLLVALAIPLSLLFAFNAMLATGIAGSLMSLGAIDFGLVVDSSVIQVENVTSRLAAAPPGRSVRAIVQDAALEVRKPTLFGELIIAIVYLPVLVLEGVEGKLFRPMALTVIFALAGSAFLSVTLVPVLSSLVLRRGVASREPWLVRVLARAYRPLLELSLRRRFGILAAAAAVLAASAVLAPRLGSEFVPRLREGALVINTVRLAGVSLEESVRYGQRLEQLLLEQYPDEIAHVWTRTGTAEVATDPMGFEVSDVFLTLTPRGEWTRATTQDELVTAMAATVEGLPGMRSVFTQPIELRVNEMLAGIRADVGIKIFGADFDVLRELADEVTLAVGAVPGSADITVEQLTGLPVLQVELQRDNLSRHGVPAREVLELIEALGQVVVGEIREGQRRFDLVVRLDDRYRAEPERLGTIMVATPAGGRVPLAELARLRVEEAPASIAREWAERRLVVQANARGRDVGSFAAEVGRAVAENVELPPGYHVELAGQFEHLERARRRLLLVVPMAIALILTLLYVTYGRLSDVLLVATSIPFAAVGGIAALAARGLPFSISAGVGFVALSGVAVLGEMVLVSRLRQLLDEGLDPLEALRRAAAGRMRPVLMTGLVAALGFLPMALNTGVGAEVQRPLATVVVGGVFSSTLTTLLVFPALYATFGLRGARPPGVPEGDEVRARPAAAG